MGRQAKLKARSRTAQEMPRPTPSAAAAPGRSVPAGAIVSALIVLTLAIFGRVAGHEFTTFDDPLYVTNNEMVKGGLSAGGFRYAFTTFDTGNWFPLTWLTLMLDTTLFGVNAGASAMVNVLLHAAATALLFLALRAVSGATWRPALVTALFAIHPAHVESVAWISERKDVLSALFGFATILAYAIWVRNRSAGRYALMIGLFVAGLMAKSMLVTIPFALLLLDFWPLQRMKEGLGRLIVEKLPLFALSAAASVAAFLAQRAGGAVAQLDTLPLAGRLENAAVSYVRYLRMLFWPADLAVFYPYDYTISTAALAGSVGLLIAITAAAFIGRRQAAWLLTGWLWFLGTLVPVIGIVQVGLQSVADRYTYLPSIGIFIIVAWGGAHVARSFRVPRIALATAAVSIVLAFAILAFRQVGVWKNSITLFAHAVEVTRDNGLARFNLGLALREAGRREEALLQFREATAAAIRATPPREVDGQMIIPFASWFARAHTEAAAELIEASGRLRASGRDAEADAALKEAVGRLEQASKADPSLAEARSNLASAYALSGRGSEAAQTLAGARSYDDHLNLGAVLSRDGRIDEALEEFRAAARLQPDNVEPMIYVGLGLAQAGRANDAIAELTRAQRKNEASANDFLTRALRLPPKETNLQEYIAFLRSQPGPGAADGSRD